MPHIEAKVHRRAEVREKARATDAELERVVVLIDGLFAIDREARVQNLSLDDRHALRQERAPALLQELHSLLLKMKGRMLPKSAEGKAASYTALPKPHNVPPYRDRAKQKGLPRG